MSWEKLSANPELLYRLRPPDEVLAEALEGAADHQGTGASLEVARLLEILAGGPSVGRVLEIGRGGAVAVICLARGAARAVVVSVGGGEEDRAETERLLERAGVGERVMVVPGEPLEAVDSLPEQLETGHFDRIHLSRDAAEVRRLVDRLLPRLAVGGLLTVEGVGVTDGEAAPADADERRSTAGYLVMHPQLATQVLALPGEPPATLAVARKRQPLVTEMGGPY